MARLQAVHPEERDVLKELHKALQSGDATDALKQQTDRILLAYLDSRYRQPERSRLRLRIGALLGKCVILLAISKGWIAFSSFFIGLSIFLIAQSIVLFLDWAAYSRSGALEMLRKRLEVASLPTLLDAFALRITSFDEAIRTGLTKRLAQATGDELATLTPEQRQHLVRFSQLQIQPQWLSQPILSDGRARAATFAYLALATLQEPGAENPDRRGLTAQHDNLRAAIDEYLVQVRLRA